MGNITEKTKTLCGTEVNESGASERSLSRRHSSFRIFVWRPKLSSSDHPQLTAQMGMGMMLSESNPGYGVSCFEVCASFSSSFSCCRQLAATSHRDLVLHFSLRAPHLANFPVLAHILKGSDCIQDHGEHPILNQASACVHAHVPR